MTSEQKTIDRKKLKFEFSGDAGDYFGIWIVNALLTVVTLGLYSPWAKVRKLQYFYGSTKIANGSFQFLANPLSMLKFRILAILLLIIYFMSEQLFAAHEIAAIIYGSLFGLYLLFAPVLMVLVLSFRLRYSAWRNIRFSFNKDYWGAYRVYLAPNIVFLLLLVSVFIPFYMSSVEKEVQKSDVQAETITPDGQADISVNTDDQTELSNEIDIDNSIMDNPIMDNPIMESRHYNDQDVLSNSEENEIEDTGGETQASEEYEEDYNSDDDEYEQEDGYEENYDVDVEPDTQDSTFDELLEGIEKEQFLPSLILLILFVLLLPYFDFINARYITRNARFGTAQCMFSATTKDYYWLYGKICFVTLCLLGTWRLNDMIDVGAVTFILTCLTVVAFLYLKPYFKARRYNLLFGHLHIGDGHRLRANANPLFVLWLNFSNSVGIMFSGGLLIPWAHIRTARYYLSITHLESSGDINEFLVGQEEQANALAEEISDVFDIEI